MPNWDSLFESAEKKTNSTFGDLQEDQNYNLEVSDGSRVIVTKSGFDMLMLKTKTISGESGIGSFVTGMYSIRPDADEKSQKMDNDSLKLIVGLTDLTKTDFIGKENAEVLEMIKDKLIGKTFFADIKSNGEYNGTKNWLIKSFSVSKDKPVSATADADPVTGEVPADIKITDFMETKSEFTF